MAIAIVAIPRRPDRVWKISSEKIPHMTLMILNDNLQDVPRVTEFIQHAVDTSPGDFMMEVDRRGVLGPKNADVLFFGKYNRKPLEDFRSYLLTNNEIADAYHSIEQFPEWVPHLTLGYPEAPAREDGEDYPISYLTFDKIALWTGEFEGVEFPLKESALSMAERGRDFLAHYGVKGMKWGVIRSKASGVGAAGKAVVKEAYKPSKDAIEAQRYMARAKLGGVRNLNNAEMQRVIRRMQLEQQYKDLYGERQWHTAGKKWATKFATDVLKDVTASWLRNPFASKKAEQDPVRVQAWTLGQEFAGELQGSRRKAIGR